MSKISMATNRRQRTIRRGLAILMAVAMAGCASQDGERYQRGSLKDTVVETEIATAVPKSAARTQDSTQRTDASRRQAAIRSGSPARLPVALPSAAEAPATVMRASAVVVVRPEAATVEQPRASTDNTNTEQTESEAIASAPASGAAADVAAVATAPVSEPPGSRPVYAPGPPAHAPAESNASSADAPRPQTQSEVAATAVAPSPTQRQVLPSRQLSSAGESRALLRKTLDEADVFLKAGQVAQARALLEATAMNGGGDELTALAATYDPVVLVSYPAAQRFADARRARELYSQAADLGSAAARERLDKLDLYLARQRR